MPALVEEDPPPGDGTAQRAGTGDVPGEAVGEHGDRFPGARDELLQAYAAGGVDQFGVRAGQFGLRDPRAVGYQKPLPSDRSRRPVRTSSR
ncbi:hypothetical protein KRMM14A1004_03190 [Krasilnikovia sp. MM14-A1004]